MREIVLDTETTGLDPLTDRIIEIGCVELLDKKATGREFHCYINPQKPIPREATNIHGITDQQVKDAPIFAAIAEKFLDFIGEEVPIVAHNASFDLAFINAELRRLNRAILPETRIIDSLKIAKELFPRERHNLNALCKRYNIDISARQHHGALLDAGLLALVYQNMSLSLTNLAFGFNKQNIADPLAADFIPAKQRPKALVQILTLQEKQDHEALLAKMDKPLWRKFLPLGNGK